MEPRLKKIRSGWKRPDLTLAKN